MRHDGRTSMTDRNVQERKGSDMVRTSSGDGRRGRGRAKKVGGRAAALLAALLLVVWTGCENPLNVENPNKLTQENVSSPEAYGALVGASRNNVVRAANGMLAIMENASDESFWIGSRNAWGALDNGLISDPTNEFTDVTWPNVGQARFTADQAVLLGEQFQSDGTLPSPDLLAEAYLYAGTLYTLIADTWQRYVLPEDLLDPEAPGEPIPASEMPALYDTAIQYLTDGLGVVQDDVLEVQLLAMRARARQAKQIRLQIQSGNPTSNQGVVASPQAATDAQDALDLAAGVDGALPFELVFDAGLLGINCESFAPQVWERGELQVGDQPAPNNRYVFLSNSNKTVDGPKLSDAIDTGTIDPRFAAALTAFRSGGRNANMTEMSVAELHLIIAEDALANGQTGVFETHINANRPSSLTQWDDANLAHPPAEVMLQHERNVNLIWQGRRLADHYRFGSQDPLWQASSVAVQEPGTLFPITITEVRSNPNVGD